MILSDHTIREELSAGRIVIDPVDDSCIQPSSVDLRLDNMFRVFLNHTMPVIDVKQDLEDLTRLVQIDADDVFILHPGEFVLASTYEKVGLPDDLVARIEGKSSLGRLGLLIHSSLPGSEPVLVVDRDGLVPRPIEDVVRKRQRAMVAAFDPDTFRVGYHEITGWYEGPPDRIYQIRLASGRRVRVTAGHNLFTIDRAGELTKVRTGALRPGMRVAVPRLVPDPGTWSAARQASLTPAGLDVAAGAATDIVAGPLAGEAPEIVVADLVPESATGSLTVSGPAVRSAFEQRPRELAELLRAGGYAATTYYRRRAVLPYGTARLVPGLLRSLGRDDCVGWRGGRNAVPARIAVDADVAWLLGLYVAEGYRRQAQVVLSNTDQEILDRVARILRRLGLGFHRAPGAVTCGSSVLAALLGWLGTGDRAPTKRVPTVVFGWPRPHVQAFVDGVVAGDGSLAGGRTSVWTTSDRLVGDLLLLFARLGRRAGSCGRPARGSQLPLWQVYAPDRTHKLLTGVPLPDRLLVDLRTVAGLGQAELARAVGYRHPTDLNNIERRRDRDAVRVSTVKRLRDGLAPYVEHDRSFGLLDRLVDGDLVWDAVVAVEDTGRTETIFDLEVRPGGRKIENFLAGHGGVFVSNTAGFVDAGFSGHITLELSNVANLPITLYPRMKIGQISFLRMTTPADQPYGAGRGSRYQGQRGPTPSRYWTNFQE